MDGFFLVVFFTVYIYNLWTNLVDCWIWRIFPYKRTQIPKLIIWRVLNGQLCHFNRLFLIKEFGTVSFFIPSDLHRMTLKATTKRRRKTVPKCFQLSEWGEKLLSGKMKKIGNLLFRLRIKFCFRNNSFKWAMAVLLVDAGQHNVVVLLVNDTACTRFSLLFVIMIGGSATNQFILNSYHTAVSQ